MASTVIGIYRPKLDRSNTWNFPMSRTYLGPFGRYLPVLDDNEPFGPELVEPPSEGTNLTMTTYQLPPPTLPTRLQFGTDLSPGSTEPTRYNAMGYTRTFHETHASVYDEQHRRTYSYHEQLPSVSQLLTPGSQSSIPTSPFSPQHSPDLSESRSAHPSSHRNAAPGGFPNHARFAQMPLQAHSRETVPPRSEEYHVITPTSHHSPALNSPQETPPTHYQAYSEQNRHVVYGPPSVQAAPLNAPGQYYQTASQSYGHLPTFLVGSTPSRQNFGHSLKPLPQVVDEQEIPGEGPCWVYADGSTCKKVIDGEEVNAQWGITKAGKPRKRLAIACTTCREKKIKCDPGTPKCVQCDKFGRECRFTTA